MKLADDLRLIAAVRGRTLLPKEVATIERAATWIEMAVMADELRQTSAMVDTEDRIERR